MKARLLIYSFLSLALALPICTSRALESSVASNNSGASNVKTVQTGVIRGQVHFDGLAPKPARIIMSDPTCSSVRSGAMAGDDFVLGANSKLANVVVFIAEGLGDERYTPPTTPVVMEQKGCMYKPHVVALQTNQKLEIVNSDKTLHNIHPAPLNNREWNKAQPGGSTMEESFAREEIAIPVKCNVHPWMKSYIAVFKHPFFSVTSQDGSFELPNLPPGEYTLEAWHEELGTLKQKITVSAGGVTTTDLVFKSPAH
jgi:plastocyanin